MGLERARAELWLADIAPAADPAWVTGFEPQLSASERARLARLVRPQRRQQFLAAHALARRAVAAYAGLAASAVQIVQDPAGRPHVGAPPGLRISLAHADGCAAVLLDAASREALGVDLEACRPERDIEAIVAALGESAASRFDAYARWALHEARHKAPGAASGWVGAWRDFVLAAAGVDRPPLVRHVALDGDAEPVVVHLEWAARSEDLAVR